MKTTKSEIEVATSVLKGQRLSNCVRAANMAMFEFGKGMRENGPSTASEVHASQFALHVQCAWRICRNDRVIVAGGDLPYPAEYREGEPVPEDFDWDRDPNRLDKQIEIFFGNGTKEFVVVDVSVGRAGSLYVAMSGDLFLEVFPDNSLLEEHWRLFSPGSKTPHFVVTGDNV